MCLQYRSDMQITPFMVQEGDILISLFALQESDMQIALFMVEDGDMDVFTVQTGEMQIAQTCRFPCVQSRSVTYRLFCLW